MRQYIRARVAPLTLVTMALVAITACSEKKADPTLAQDSALGRDLAMAARDSTVQPALKDVPTTPPPAEAAPPKAEVIKKPTPTKPKPTTPPPTVTPPATNTTPTKAAEPLVGTVAAGTTLKFASNSKVCSNTHKVGDKFTGDLSETVSATNGIDIPAGATGTFEVTESKTAKNSNDNTILTVKLISIQVAGKTYPVDATLQTASTERARSASKGTDAKKVAGAAVIGAIAGQVIGKNTKGTVIGAAAGAAAGTAAAVATADYDTCLNGGGAVTVKLDAPVAVRPVPVP